MCGKRVEGEATKQAYWSMWSGQSLQQVETHEKTLREAAKASFDAYLASKNAPPQVLCVDVIRCHSCVCVSWLLLSLESVF